MSHGSSTWSGAVIAASDDVVVGDGNPCVPQAVGDQSSAPRVCRWRAKSEAGLPGRRRADQMIRYAEATVEAARNRAGA